VTVLENAGLLFLSVCRGAALAIIFGLAAYGGQHLLVHRGWVLPDIVYTLLAAIVFGIALGHTIQYYQRALKARGVDWPKGRRPDP